ncbi:MAG: NAD(P)-dependent oxidoreductase, partial [Ekhidna sp.]
VGKGHEVKIFRGDLLERKSVEEFFDLNPDLSTFIHLAGSFYGELSDVIAKNTLASANLIDFITLRKNVRLIFTSTGAVYGNTGSKPAVEDQKLTPITTYGFAKKWAEELFLHYVNLYSIELVTLRLPSVYGPGNDKGVIHSWIKSVKESSTITLNGDGGQLRSFLHINDLIEVIDRFISHAATGTYNVAGRERLSLSELANIFSAHLEFETVLAPQDNRLQSMVLDIDKVSRTLDWTPRYYIEDFIQGQTKL